MPHLNFHQQNHRRHGQNIPRGHVAVTVGPDRRRFAVPVLYVNHPLFTSLLKEVEDEYGSDYYPDGPIHIPCPEDEFRRVMGLIDEETAPYHHHDDHHHHHQFLCFKASV